MSLATVRQNQFLILIKPESLQRPRQNQSQRLVELILTTLATFGLDIRGAVAVAGELLSDSRVIDRHYGYINHMSRFASAELDGKTGSKVRNLVGAPATARIIGGHEMLAVQCNLNADQLNDLWAHRPALKVRSGLYAELHELDGESLVIINGFHPKQIAHFTRAGSYTIALLANSDLPWRLLRTHMIGDTFPTKALEGSVRRSISERRAEFGFGCVDESNNCIHMSAGPFEALSEIVNFIGLDGRIPIDLEACRQIQHLRATQWTGSVEQLVGNPVVRVGEILDSLFELTDGLDGCSSAKLVARSLERGFSE